MDTCNAWRVWTTFGSVSGEYLYQSACACRLYEYTLMRVEENQAPYRVSDITAAIKRISRRPNVSGSDSSHFIVIRPIPVIIPSIVQFNQKSTERIKAQPRISTWWPLWTPSTGWAEHISGSTLSSDDEEERIEEVSVTGSPFTCAPALEEDPVIVV